ncbi:MAG TPA: hypothetical protein VF121_10030 [Thermoanaerobaculia bacterium]|nr:hypothetical protein [Thermoanaerobaculia bacterium]
MTEWLRSRKRAAAMLMVAGLATLLAFWGIQQAGEVERARRGELCRDVELAGLVLRLELAPSPADFERELRRAPEECVREAARAMVERDWVLLPSYGFFVALIFLLLANLRLRGPAAWSLWVGLGLALAAAAVAADAWENRLLLRLLDAERADAATLEALHQATAAKWGLLAVAAAAAALLWVRRPRPVGDDAPLVAPQATARQASLARLAPWLRWGVALLGAAAAAVILWGLAQPDRALQLAALQVGILLLVASWSCAFARALVVAAEPMPFQRIGEVAVEAAAGEACSPPEGTAPKRDSPFERGYPLPLFAREWGASCERRRRVGLPVDGPRVGFGLSGGGIRSATLNLGLFQKLSEIVPPAEPKELPLLGRFDFISTVSGGGYFGSFLGRLWTRKFVRTPAHVATALRGIDAKDGSDEIPGRKVMRYLRENGRYLSPNGAGDLLLGGAVALRNWVSVQLVLLTFLLTVVLGLQAARPGLEWLVARPVLKWLAPSFELAGGGFWWSPWLLLPLLGFAFVAFPLGWAYWMVEPLAPQLAGAKAGQPLPPRRRWGWDRSAIAPVAGLVLTLVVALVMVFGVRRPASRAVWILVALTAALAFAWWLVARWLARRQTERADDGAREPAPAVDLSGELSVGDEAKLEKRIHRHHTERGWLSSRLAEALLATGVLLALGLVDSLGQSLYVKLLQPGDLWGGWLAGVGSGVALLLNAARRLAALRAKGPGDERPGLPLNLLAGAAAFLLVALILVAVDAASHAVAWRAALPTAEGPQRDQALAAIALLTAFVLSVFFGQTFPFVNRSSHHALYSSRLTRAYLGASNRRRLLRAESVTRVIRGDDIDLMRYWPPPAAKAAPVHLINVTLNETLSGRSQVEQKDRRGTNLALGPFGFSAGIEHHAIVPLGKMDPYGQPVTVYPQAAGEFRVFEYPRVGDGRIFTGESLSLGDWVGISGAAFSTGLGARTSLGLSLLAGFANVRLGRWWDSGVDVAARQDVVRPSRLVRLEHAVARLFPVQVFLLDEFVARFHGPARRHWYLSDGGHFENLAGYELIRRRLPVIVLVDAEQDQDFVFGGLSNLVRKARIDFGAEVTFLEKPELDAAIDPPMPGVVGTLEDLRRKKDTGYSGAHAALARIRYEDEPGRTGEVLYVKATLTGDEPADVIEYSRAHPAFPHESTGDQFFDEAQWESYRKLGEHIAHQLFPGAWPGTRPKDRRKQGGETGPEKPPQRG